MPAMHGCNLWKAGISIVAPRQTLAAKKPFDQTMILLTGELLEMPKYSVLTTSAHEQS